MLLPSSNSSLSQIRYSWLAILVNSSRHRQSEGGAFLLHQLNDGGALEFLCLKRRKAFASWNEIRSTRCWGTDASPWILPTFSFTRKDLWPLFIAICRVSHKDCMQIFHYRLLKWVPVGQFILISQEIVCHGLHTNDNTCPLFPAVQKCLFLVSLLVTPKRTRESCKSWGPHI